MVALLPASPDTLTVAGGDPPEELHLTLRFLGEAALLDDPTRTAILERVASVAGMGPPIDVVGSGLVIMGEDDQGQPATAVLCENEDIVFVRDLVDDVLDDLAVADDTHPVFIPHLTLGYGLDPTAADVVTRSTAPITFDRLVVAFGEDRTEYPLASASGATDSTEAAMPSTMTVRSRAQAAQGDPPADVGAVFDFDATPVVFATVDMTDDVAVTDALAAIPAFDLTAAVPGDGTATLSGPGLADFRSALAATADTTWPGADDSVAVALVDGATLADGDTVTVDSVTVYGAAGPVDVGLAPAAPATPDTGPAPTPPAKAAADTPTPMPTQGPDAATPASVPGDPRFTAVLVVEGVPSGDGRMIQQGALTWRDLPLPFMAMFHNPEGGMGHDGAEIAGRIDNVYRDGDKIMAEGEYDLGGPSGVEAMRLRDNGMLRGVSVDLDMVEAEYENELPLDGGLEDLLTWDAGMLIVTSARVMGACHDDETEILTETRGWVRFAELLPDERVATRNPKTGAFEWQEFFYFHHDEWAGPMYRFTARNMDQFVTPNHRMCVVSTATGETEYVPAEELATKAKGLYRIPITSTWDAADVEQFRIVADPVPAGQCACGCGGAVGTRGGVECSVDGCDRLSTGRGMCNSHYQRWYSHGDPSAGRPDRPVRTNVRYDATQVTLPGHGHGLNRKDRVFAGDDWVAFMGMYLAEGCLQRGRSGCSGVFISQQTKSKGYVMYKSLLERMFSAVHVIRNGFIVSDARLGRYLEPLGKAWEKSVPTEVKNFSARQLRIFLDFYLAGDGDLNNGRWRATTTSPRLAGDLQEIAQKCGMFAKIRERTQQDVVIEGRLIPVERQHRCYSVTFANWPGRRKTTSVDEWAVERVEHHVGDVYCVSVPNETLYVRRNGKAAFSGNTATVFPAFPEAKIIMSDAEPSALLAAGGRLPSATVWTPWTYENGTLVAAGSKRGGYPANPPLAWMERPSLDDDMYAQLRSDPNLAIITDEGRYLAYLGTWDSCHVSFDGRCVPMPRSTTGYRGFRCGSVLTSEGTVVATGVVILDTVHPDLKLSASDAQAFYAHSGSGAVDVAPYEDDIGVLLCGALRPDVTDAQVRVLRASRTSGDWRRVDNHPRELIAVLTVNLGGFRSMRPATLVASGALEGAGDNPRRPGAFAFRLRDNEVETLVAAGSVASPLQARLDALEAKVESLMRTTHSVRAEHVRRRWHDTRRVS
jgi:hypothetical protein